MTNTVTGPFEDYLRKERIPMDPALSLMADAHRRLAGRRDLDGQNCGFLEGIPTKLGEVFSRSLTEQDWTSTWPGIDLLLLDVPGSTITEQGGAVLLVRMSPGTEARPHKHKGHEFNLVLEGSVAAGRGDKFRGDLVHNRAGTVHQVRTINGDGCVALSIVTSPFEVLGESGSLQS